MTLNAFLASLPSLLAITGFVIYQMLRSNIAADPIVRDVLTKVRKNSPDTAARFSALKGKDLENALKRDNKLREIISQQDSEILQKTLDHRLFLSLVVYVLTAILFVAGAVFFLKTLNAPTPLLLTDCLIQSTNPAAGGKSVDLDAIEVAWKADGEPEDVTVYLENVQTLRRSAEMRTNSRQRRITFAPKDYSDCLADRSLHGKNRIRAVCQGLKKSFNSDEVDLLIGIQILTFFDSEKNSVCIAAMIDNSAIPFYAFDARAVVWTFGNPPQLLTFGGTNIVSVGRFPVGLQSNIRWDTLRVHYLGPDNSDIIRTKVGL
jgi:hypothetical protein